MQKDRTGTNDRHSYTQFPVGVTMEAERDCEIYVLACSSLVRMSLAEWRKTEGMLPASSSGSRGTAVAECQRGGTGVGIQFLVT